MPTATKKTAASRRAGARSGNPATRAAAQNEVSGVGDFKAKRGGVFTLPSGAKARLHNPGGLKIFAQQGIIPNSLMGIVNEAMESGKDPDMSSLKNKEGEFDMELLADMVQLMDACCITCFIEPQVNPVPADEADRDPELLYVDELLEEDKTFVFQWVSGGTSDVEQFRREQAQELVALQPGNGPRVPAKRAPRRR